MPDASFMDSMMQCHLKVASQQGGSSGKNQFRPNEPNGPNGAPSDMLQCMMTAANGV